MTADVSIVIPSHNEGAMLAHTISSVVQHTEGIPYEIIIVDDRSIDGSGVGAWRTPWKHEAVRLVSTRRQLGVSGARAHGARRARGDVLVFLDAHTEVEPGWLDGLCRQFHRNIGVVGAVIGSLNGSGGRGMGQTLQNGGSLLPTWLPELGTAKPYAIPFSSSAGHAVSRAAYEKIGGYDTGMGRWGSEDVEFCMRMWAFGFDVLLEPSVELKHMFRTTHPYPVDMAQVLYNRLRMGYLHLNEDRMGRVIEHYKDELHFAPALGMLIRSDVGKMRARLDRKRERDDDWLCETFGIKV